MRLELPNEAPIDDPSQEQLVAAIDRAGTPEQGVFLILSRSGDGGDFMQALAAGTGFTVEYRDGQSGRHYQSADKLPTDRVRELFAAYLRGDESFRDSVEWRDITGRLSQERRNRIAVIIGVVLAAALLCAWVAVKLYQLVKDW